MIDDIQLLKSITETADMGRDSLKHVIEKATDPDLKAALQKQFSVYDSTFVSAEQILNAKGEPSQKTGAPVKIYSHVVSDLKTITAENARSKIAEMVIQGSTMGVTEMTKQLNSYQGSDQAVRGLAERHIKTEQDNIEEMKKYL